MPDGLVIADLVNDRTNSVRMKRHLRQQFGRVSLANCVHKVGNEMRRQLGFYMQFSMLVFLPMLVFWQLQYGFHLIWMPALLLVGVVFFIVGTRLRES